MPKYKAKKNLTIGTGEKDQHKHVKKGDVFEVSEEYADAHLHPHDHVEETDEAVTEHPAVAKAKAVKAAKSSKKADEEKSAKKADDEKTAHKGSKKDEK